MYVCMYRGKDRDESVIYILLIGNLIQLNPQFAIRIFSSFLSSSIVELDCIHMLYSISLRAIYIITSSVLYSPFFLLSLSSSYLFLASISVTSTVAKVTRYRIVVGVVVVVVSAEQPGIYATTQKDAPWPQCSFPSVVVAVSDAMARAMYVCTYVCMSIFLFSFPFLDVYIYMILRLWGLGRR